MLVVLQGNMKQHQMTHKFRDSEPDSSRPAVSTTPDSKSSPFTSPASSDHSPPFSVSAGVKRPGEEESGGQTSGEESNPLWINWRDWRDVKW